MKPSIQQNRLMAVAEVSDLIEKGRKLVLSGEEHLLAQLPQGTWIGGTIPYFYLHGEMGKMDKEHIFVCDFTDTVAAASIATYDVDTLHRVAEGGFANGFNFLILPALRDIHMEFALRAPDYEGLYENPLVGLIAGVDLEEFAQGRLSKTFNGQTGRSYTDKGVAFHAQLPPHEVARLEIVNVFEPSHELRIEVDEDSFVVGDCRIDGRPANLYRYIVEHELDTSRPLVSDYAGATINVSFQRLDPEKEQVVFYAPLFAGLQYTPAKPIGDYAQVFQEKVASVYRKEKQILYNCNCILNYVYGQLDQRDIGFSGPTTFGEVAYNLLNQTFTYLALDKS
jgi:hypothetical protein